MIIKFCLLNLFSAEEDSCESDNGTVPVTVAVAQTGNPAVWSGISGRGYR